MTVTGAANLEIGLDSPTACSATRRALASCRLKVARVRVLPYPWSRYKLVPPVLYNSYSL
jgi:hypothetical protein